MNRLIAMQIFVRVAELSSFSRTAEALGLPKTTVSAAVQELESELGTRLLHRTTRKVQMTLDGQAYYDRCKDLLADFDEVDSMFQNRERALKGRLRVDMPSAMARKFVLPRLALFLAEHPHIDLELSSTDRYVDVISEGFDCVVRGGVLQDTSLIARPLGTYQIANCASPGYLQEYGTPRTIDDLSPHKLIHYVSVLGAKSAGFEYRVGEESVFLPMAGALTVNNADAYEHACLAGLGIIQSPAAGLREHFRTGRLVELLKDFSPPPMPISIVYAHRRNLSRRLRVFIDWIAALLQPHLDD